MRGDGVLQRGDDVLQRGDDVLQRGDDSQADGNTPAADSAFISPLVSSEYAACGVIFLLRFA